MLVSKTRYKSLLTMEQFPSMTTSLRAVNVRRMEQERREFSYNASLLADDMYQVMLGMFSLQLADS